MRLFWMPVPPALVEAVRACRTHFLLAAAFSALINILYLAPTIYMMQVYDRVVPTNGVLTLVFITLVVGVAIATLSALDAMRVRLMARASLRLNRLLSGEILDRLLARSRALPGDPSTQQAMREFDMFRQSLGGPAAIALFDVPWTPLYLLVAFLIHPLLGVLVLGAGGVLIALAISNEKRSKAKADEAHQATALAYESHEATLRKAELVRALGMRRALVARHIRQRSVGLDATAELQFSSSRYNGLVKFVRMFMQSFALGIGAWLAINGQISVGAIIAASVLLSRALQPIEQLVGLWPSIVQSRQALQTLGRLFDTAPVSSFTRTTLPDPEGFVELDRVVVRNPEASAILLKNVSLKLVPGEALGVVGPSGAGKTTLARIVAGALPPRFRRNSHRRGQRAGLGSGRTRPTYRLSAAGLCASPGDDHRKYLALRRRARNSTVHYRPGSRRGRPAGYGGVRHRRDHRVSDLAPLGLEALGRRPGHARPGPRRPRRSGRPPGRRFVPERGHSGTARRAP